MTHPPDEYAQASFETMDSPATAVAEMPQPLTEIRARPVVVTGAAGLVGSHLCTQLVSQGWKVRAIVRDASRAVHRLGHLRLEMREGDIRNAESMRSALEGAGSVVHLAAIAIEGKGQSYADTNTDATRVLLESAKSAQVRRIVYMSQNGADKASPHAFLRSKGIAQEMVMESGMQWTVIRPSVIFGPEDEFVNVLARLVRLSPIVFPLPGGGVARFQPVAVVDVARAVVKVLRDDSSIGRVYSIGGSTPLTLRQMTERILVAMNASRVLVSVPVGALRPLIAAAQRMLPNPPVTTALLDLLDVDNVIEPNDLQGELGITPVPFAPEELLYLRQITAGSAFRSMLRH
ncbi:MAG: NAD(P)H-binding protein [Gemmatimonadales bacterium]